MTLKNLHSPAEIWREFLHDPQALTVGFFAIAMIGMMFAAWLIVRNVRHNEPGLKAPAAFVFALVIATFGLLGAHRLPRRGFLPVSAGVILVAGSLFCYADRNRFVRAPDGRIVADRWEVVLKFARFRWTRDKANRHFFFTGDTGSGKTTGMNALLAALMSRDPNLGGVVMANKGDEWFFLEWLAKKYGRTGDLIRLRPRIAGEPEVAAQHRLNVTGDSITAPRQNQIAIAFCWATDCTMAWRSATRRAISASESS